MAENVNDNRMFVMPACIISLRPFPRPLRLPSVAPRDLTGYIIRKYPWSPSNPGLLQYVSDFKVRKVLCLLVADMLGRILSRKWCAVLRGFSAFGPYIS